MAETLAEIGCYPSKIYSAPDRAYANDQSVIDLVRTYVAQQTQERIWELYATDDSCAQGGGKVLKPEAFAKMLKAAASANGKDYSDDRALRDAWSFYNARGPHEFDLQLFQRIFFSEPVQQK